MEQAQYMFLILTAFDDSTNKGRGFKITNSVVAHAT